MIKILFIGMTPNSGGMETFMMNIFSKLEGHGFHFEFLNIFSRDISYSKYILSKNGAIYRLKFPKNNIKRHFSRYSIAKHFFKYHHDYDIVHLNALTINNIFWIKAARKYGIKHLIIHSHNCGIEYNNKLIAFLAHFLFLYNRFYLRKHIDIVKLAASYNCGKWMFGNMPFKVINNGVYTRPYIYNSNNRIELKRKFGISQEDKIIITTARLWKQKNYPKIIRIFNIINKINRNVKLVIIGSGPDYQLIVHLVNSYNLTNYVYFLGQKTKKEISVLLSLGDLMLMPSLHEAVPFSLTEAQAAGVPALVSLHAIPKEANITGQVHYLSLRQSNLIWAKEALKILNEPFTSYDKLVMNKQITNSGYNVNNSINKVKSIYKYIVDRKED